MSTTTDFSEFGYREREMAAELLLKSCENEFPWDDFSRDGVQIVMNTDSGDVYFLNSEYKIAMINGDSLEIFYTTPYSGYEGFADDLFQEFMENTDEWDIEDVEYLYDVGILGIDDLNAYNDYMARFQPTPEDVREFIGIQSEEDEIDGIGN